MSNYPAKPIVKKLYATLMKLNMGSFLIKEDYKLILMEHNLDELWDSCIGQVRSESSVAILIPEYTGDATDALLRFLDALYVKEYSKHLINFLDDVLIEFAKEGNTSIDSSELKTRLGTMTLFSKDRVERMKIFKFKPKKPIKKSLFSKKNKIKTEIDSKKIFVVHGRDEIAKNELVEIFKDELDLEPIVLSEEPNEGKTVIEKFENKTLKVGYAIIILTPDDLGGLKEDLDKMDTCDKKLKKLKLQARENVILELGYFIGKLQREKVCCIMKGNGLLPSDLHGIVTIRYQDSIKDKFLQIKKELKNTGYVK